MRAPRTLFEGAIALVRELNRSAVTNIDGFAEILEFRNGKYHVDLIVDGVVKKTLVVEVKRGKVVEIAEAI